MIVSLYKDAPARARQTKLIYVWFRQGWSFLELIFNWIKYQFGKLSTALWIVMYKIIKIILSEMIIVNTNNYSVCIRTNFFSYFIKIIS